MVLDAGGGGGRDLTPGDIHIMPTDKLKVETGSLLEVGASLRNINNAFKMNSITPTMYMSMGDNESGEGPVGGDSGSSDYFSELYWVALSTGNRARDAKELTADLTDGQTALSEVCLVMSEKYGGADGFAAGALAGRINDLFNPPAGAKNTLAHDRAQAEAAAAREQERVSKLPTYSNEMDVMKAIQRGKRPGIDFIDGTVTNPMPTVPTGVDSNGNPTTDPTAGNSNPYFDMPMQEQPEYDPYIPPAPQDPNDLDAIRHDENGAPYTLQGQLDEHAESGSPCVEAYVSDGQVKYRDSGMCA